MTAPAIKSPSKREIARQTGLVWRAECVEAFAQFDEAMIVIIKLLSRSCDPLPFYFGKRRERLRELLSESETRLHRNALAAIVNMAATLDHRNLLVHATSDFSSDPQGKWRWSYHYRPTKRDVDDKKGVMHQDEGDTLLTAIQKANQRLRSYHGCFAKEMS